MEDQTIITILKELDTICENYPVIKRTPYVYDGKYVPRVTEILSSMLHEDYLMSWSNSIGLYGHKRYQDVLDKAANIGTMVHEAIEKFIKTGGQRFGCEEPVPVEAYRAFNSFIKWWEIISTHNIKILMQEQPLVTKYFGGTLDLLIEIDGSVYLVDFKTSNHPSYRYTLQLAAYRYALKELYNIKVDGCIILMLNKDEIRFNEIFIDMNMEYYLIYMNQCLKTFLGLVHGYYNRLIVQEQFDNVISKGKRIKY